MTEDSIDAGEIEQLCRRIEALASAKHLSEEQKLSFARKALEILAAKEGKGEVQ